jgi:hypothetical protein
MIESIRNEVSISFREDLNNLKKTLIKTTENNNF